MKNRIILAILILLWMITVFCFSDEDGQESSNTSGEIVEVIVETIQSETIEEDEVEVIVRKGAHLTLYTLGGVLIFMFCNTFNIVWKKKILYTIVIGVIYAITDEIHQGFIPGRTPKVLDIAIDTAGINLRNCNKLCDIKGKNKINRQKNIKSDKKVEKICKLCYYIIWCLKKNKQKNYGRCIIMNAKVMEVTEAIMYDLETGMDISTETDKKYTVDENVEVTAIRINKSENKIHKNINLFIKRIVDIIGGIVGIMVLIPLTIIIAIVNFINKENGPLFYSHKRIGKDGKYFKMYKFRTMVVDADKKLYELLEKDEEMKKEWQENRKLKNDPRITKIGKILRKTSLDEFPQFLNVLKGEMSLVGPRAVVDGEIEKFGIYKKDILSVKPGITGYWAAHGRSDTSYEERVHMEYKYVDNFSVWMDIKILFKTVISVVKKEGAV